jgi:hypothetical protein
MSKPTIQVLGAYRVELTDELFAAAMELKYGGMKLSNKQRQDAEQAVRGELSSVALLELLVDQLDGVLDLGSFSQPGSDQAAYDEVYLTLDGTALVSRYAQPKADSFRVAFFLHFFDPAQPLETGYGQIPIPSLRKMPERLQTLVPYEPVD